jgi:hypothetical protein
MMLDLYGPLPTGRGGVKYLLARLDVFSKHVTLYPLKIATTRSCLNKLRNHYFPKVLQPPRVRFPALPEKKSSGSGTGCTQPREYN